MWNAFQTARIIKHAEICVIFDLHNLCNLLVKRRLSIDS